MKYVLVIVGAVLAIPGLGYLLGTTPSKRTPIDVDVALGAILIGAVLLFAAWRRFHRPKS